MAIGERAEAAQDKASDATLLAREHGLHPTGEVHPERAAGHRLRRPAPAGLPLSAEQQADVLARMAHIGIGKVAVPQGDD